MKNYIKTFQYGGYVPVDNFIFEKNHNIKITKNNILIPNIKIVYKIKYTKYKDHTYTV